MSARDNLDFPPSLQEIQEREHRAQVRAFISSVTVGLVAAALVALIRVVT
jgi:hypothetical protein